MSRAEILRQLKEHQQDVSKFEVKRLAIFGSAARDELRSESDIDILVEFYEPVGLFHFIRLKRYLEDVLGCDVDLVTPDALREEMRSAILDEAIYAS